MTQESLFEFKKNCLAYSEWDRPKFCGWRGGEAHQSGAEVKTADAEKKKQMTRYFGEGLNLMLRDWQIGSANLLEKECIWELWPGRNQIKCGF